MNKIQGLAPVNGSMTEKGQMGVKGRKESEARSSQAETEKDDVVLTEAAQQISKAAKSHQDMPDIDAGKVAAIKAQIENGEYRLSAARIARGILAVEKLI